MPTQPIDTMKRFEKTIDAEMSPLLQVPLAALILWAIVHAVRSRSAADFWKYSLSIATVIASLAIVGLVIYLVVARPKISFLPALGILLGAILFISFASVLYYAIGASLKDLFLWARNPSTNSWRAIVGTASVILAGSMLFAFRLQFRSVYGATEAMVGIAIGTQRLLAVPTTESPFSSDTFLALLTASIYLIVRGLDNVHHGLTKDPRDPLAQRLLNWIREQHAFTLSGDDASGSKDANHQTKG